MYIYIYICSHIAPKLDQCQGSFKGGYMGLYRDVIGIGFRDPLYTVIALRMTPHPVILIWWEFCRTLVKSSLSLLATITA